MADPTPPPADPLALLASLSTPSILVRLTALPTRPGEAPAWRLELSEDNGGSWSSLEAGKPGQATPAAAIFEGNRLIGEWRSSRDQSHTAEIAHYFTNGKLQRSKITVQDENGKSVEVDGFIATSENGLKFESINPLEAIRKEKESKGKPSVAPSESKKPATPLSSSL